VLAGGAGGAVAPEGADQAAKQALGQERKAFASVTGQPASSSGSSRPTSAAQAGVALRVPPETIKEMQSQLHADNFYDGRIDGILGPRTRIALRRYQEREGLTPTGEIDTVTLQRLAGSGIPAAGGSLPLQPADQSGTSNSAAPPGPPPQKPPVQ